jgi:large subunit ribosomal protein L31
MARRYNPLVAAPRGLYIPAPVAPAGRTSFETKSTWGKEGGSLRLDIDPKTHPAWTGVRQSIDRGGRVQRFRNRFGMIGSDKTDPPKEDAKPDAEKK